MSVAPLRLWVRVARKWDEIPNGPFPITHEQLTEMRRRFRAEWDAATGPFDGCRMSPHPTARAIVRDVVPELGEFDAGMIAYAVAFAGAVRVEVDGGGDGDGGSGGV